MITAPVLAVTAAAATLLDTIPVLRGGLGNIAWFFTWMFCAIAGGGAPLGGLGAVAASMRGAMVSQHLRPAEFSLGFTKVSHPLATFAWPGFEPSAGFVIQRLVLVLVAVGLAVLPAPWFGRFDPSRAARRRRTAAPDPSPVSVARPGSVVDSGRAKRPVKGAGPAPAGIYRPLPRSKRTAARPALARARLLAGETRILVRGISRWWWLVAAGLTAASLAVPADLVRPAGASIALLLSAAWIWPVLIWSRLGAQRRENGLDTLLGAYPGAYRQLAAEWTAGLLLTAAVGLGPLLRMILAADGAGEAAWVAGALFIPSLALTLGAVSRSHRMFQVLYVVLWYAAVNQVKAADYMGTVLVDGRPAGPAPLLIGGIAAAMLAVTFAIRAARHATR